MLVPATALAVLLYLLPVVVLAVARTDRERPLWAFALDIPLAVALDLLGNLAVSFLLPLETAALVTRALWLAGGLAVVRRRRSQASFGWPAALGGRALAAVATSAAAATGLSLLLSRPYAIWDRYWHFPLVSSIAAQRLPFHNVFQPETVLRYHFSGDVLASELVAFSGRVLHGSLALSLGHDVVFGLLGASLALLCLSSGHRGAVAIALGACGVLLCGPIWFLRAGLGKRYEGYSYLNYFEMSYRPHIALEGLFLLAVTGAVVVRLRSPRGSVAARQTAPALVGCLMVLAITDEASALLLGLSVAGAWLVCPDAVCPRRLPGLGLLALAAVGMLAVNVAFSASLSPGGPASGMAWVAARAPGFYNEGPRPLATPEGRRALLFDVAGFVTACAGLGLAWLRRVTRSGLALLAFAGVLGGVSVLLLTHIDLQQGAARVPPVHDRAGLRLRPARGAVARRRARPTARADPALRRRGRPRARHHALGPGGVPERVLRPPALRHAGLLPDGLPRCDCRPPGRRGQADVRRGVAPRALYRVPARLHLRR